MLTARDSEAGSRSRRRLGAATIYPNRLTTANWWRVSGLFCAVSLERTAAGSDNGSPTLLEVDALSLNQVAGEADFDGQTLELTGTEFTPALFAGATHSAGGFP